MRITAGRKPVATVLGIAMLTGGCAQHGAHGTAHGFPDFFNASNWTSGPDTPDAQPARMSAAPPARLPAPVISNASAAPAAPDDPHLAPVADRHFGNLPEIDPFPAPQTAKKAIVRPPSPTKPRPAATSAAAAGSTDLWDRLRAGMRLEPGPHAFLKRYIKWIGTHDRYFKRVTKRSGRYLHYVTEEVTRRGMPTEIALLPIIESGYKPFAYSKGNAAGVWQIIPSTGRQLGLKNTWWYDGRRDIVDATNAALELLTTMRANLDNDWLLALAAYNCGEGAVRRARARNAKEGKGTDYWSIRPLLPPETRAYVPRLLAVAAAVRDPSQFGLTLSDVPDKPYFDIVPVNGQVDMAIAARAAGMLLSDLQKLNPGFKRFATDPDGPHRLVVPRTRLKAFKTAMAALPDSQHMRWRRHTVKPGESLGLIAERYQTRIDVLQQVNNLEGSSLRVGKGLLVPVSSQHSKDYALAHPPVRPQSAKLVAGKPYTVRSGDSMWTIARRHNTSVGALARVNHMTQSTSLKIGQTLYLPTKVGTEKPQGKPSASDTAGKLITVSARREGPVYTVRAGDTLWTISKRFGFPIDDIRAWNQLRKGKHLMPGQVLKLYSPADQKQI